MVLSDFKTFPYWLEAAKQALPTRASEMFLMVVYHVCIAFILFWPAGLLWFNYNGISTNAGTGALDSGLNQASNTRTLFTTAFCCILAAILVDYGFIIGYSNSAKQRSIQHITGNLGFKMNNLIIKKDNLKEVHGEKTTRLPISGNTNLKLADPGTAVLTTATNMVAKSNTKIPGLTPSSFAIRELPNGDVYILSPTGAHILDDIMAPHAKETFVTVAGGGSLVWHKGGTAKKTDFTMEAMDVPSIYGSYRTTPLHAFTRNVMGFPSGLGIAVVGSRWRNEVITFYLLAAYLLILRNPTTATMAWFITVLPPYLLSFAGVYSHYFELLSLHLFYGWAVILCAQFFLVGGESNAYIHKTSIWNNTAVWQTNTSITTLDQSFTASSVTYYVFAVAALFFLAIVAQLAPSPLRAGDAEFEKTDKPRSETVSTMATEGRVAPSLTQRRALGVVS